MILAISGALLIGGAIFYFLYSTQSAASQLAAEKELENSFDEKNRDTPLPFYIKITSYLLRPPYLEIGTVGWSPAGLEKVKRKIVAAGFASLIKAEQYVAAKFFLGTGIALFVLVSTILGSPLPLWFSGLFILFAYFVADLHLAGVLKIRQKQIKISMPYVIDLLTLCMEAGLDFMGAVGKVIEKAPPGPFIEELSIVLKDIQLGKTRAKALKDMALRIDMLEVSSMVAVVVSADQMGASVGGALRGQSDLLRTERIMKAEEMGAKASQKILVPLIFLILPAVMLIIIGPVILSAVVGK